MGLFDKVREAIVKASDRIDGTAPLAPHQWSPDQAMAVLVESEQRPGSSPTTSSDGGGLVDVALDAATGIPYRFVLDVRRPGFEPYRLEQWVRIPSRVERTWTQGAAQVRAGTEVPLTVTGPAADDVEIDWDGYLAMPGRKQQTAQLAAEAQWDRMGADFERTNSPERVQKIRADHRMAVSTWADLVLVGTMTREAFERESEMAIRMGFLLPSDYHEARARLEG
jgi:hypothetical protein